MNAIIQGKKKTPITSLKLSAIDIFFCFFRKGMVIFSQFKVIVHHCGRSQWQELESSGQTKPGKEMEQCSSDML